MRLSRTCALLAALFLMGCRREEPRVVVVEVPTSPKEEPMRLIVAGDGVAPSDQAYDKLVTRYATESTDDQYQARLLEALDKLAEEKDVEALAALKAAAAVRSTEWVRLEIDKVQRAIDRRAAAESAARDISVVLADGRADDAARLGTLALAQFGDTDSAGKLEALKREADAVAAVTLIDDAGARRARFRAEADAALRDGNLRAAAVALDQVLQAGEDPDSRRQRDDVVGRLATYDDCRSRALRLRRDPAALEDGLALLQQAQAAWDTIEVRQAIDDYRFALQNRRERLSVAEFQVLGDVGAPAAGRTLAEDLLPAFKGRFDLVERGQIGAVLDELRLESGLFSDNPEAGRAAARLARVSYLVVGTLSPLNGVTVHARLIDLRTGLIVQTARLSAPTYEALRPRLPLVAQVLMMTDDQKLAFEQAQAAQPVVIPVIDFNAPLPPPPALSDPAPAPIVVFAPQPIAFGGVTIATFADYAPPPAVVIDVEPRRRRFLALQLELGDNLFRRGRKHEARRHYELALRLGAPAESAGLTVRLNQCPPPPPVVVVVAPRPRLVVFNFVVNSDPGLVPPAVGTWAADQFASSWGGTYDVVERGEVCWYMGRLGLTMRDVLADAGARRSLAQALNVQVFAFGTLQQTASFDVKTHLIDADTGVRTGGGMIHVQDHNELKLRMRELVGQSHAAPAEQARLEQAGKRSERALDDAIRLRKGGKFAEAASVARAGLKDDPHSAALQIVLQQSEDDERRAKLEAARRQEAAKLAEEAAAARKRQEKIAAELTAARERAVKEAKSQDEAARRAEEAKKTRAAEVLRTTGERALKERRYSDAVQALQSAAALAPKDAAVQKALTQARDAAKGEREARLAEEQRQAQAAELKRKADEQAKVLALKKAQAEADAARAKAKEERDKALARQQEEARRPTVPAETKPVADAKAKKLKEDFELAMSAGKAASAQKNYAGAVNAYKEALRLQPTDVAAAAALRESQRLATETAADAEAKRKAAEAAEKARLADNKAAAEAEARRKAEETKRNADFAKLVGDGQAALSAKRYADAAKVYGEALKLKPNDPAATQGLNQARAALDTPKPTPPPPATTAKPAPAPPPPPAAPSNAAVYAKAMQDGAAFDKAKKFSDAVKAYREALRVQPNDARAAAALKTADAAAHYAEGQRLQAAKKYPEAVKEYEEVLKLKPDDADAKAALKRAKDGKP